MRMESAMSVAVAATLAMWPPQANIASTRLRSVSMSGVASKSWYDTMTFVLSGSSPPPWHRGALWLVKLSSKSCCDTMTNHMQGSLRHCVFACSSGAALLRVNPLICDS